MVLLLPGLPEQIFKLPNIADVNASDNMITNWPKKLDKLEKKASVNTGGKTLAITHTHARFSSSVW